MASPRPRPTEASDEPVRSSAAGQSDALLVAALQAGRADARRLLFERYGNYVERLVVRVLGLDAEVPDLINEVFARALERIAHVADPAALKGWLGSVALFTARAFLRDRRSRRRFLGFFWPTPRASPALLRAPNRLTSLLETSCPAAAALATASASSPSTNAETLRAPRVGSTTTCANNRTALCAPKLAGACWKPCSALARKSERAASLSSTWRATRAVRRRRWPSSCCAEIASNFGYRARRDAPDSRRLVAPAIVASKWRWSSMSVQRAFAHVA